MEKDLSGWLNIDKPINYSSAKVVAIVKKIINAKKVGHGGTLDPLATGVLPICLNKATKTTEKMMNFDKEYLFNITFGELRSTADAEGEVLETNNKIPTEEEILKTIPKFIGSIKQTPPIFSAIKVDGKRAYNLARDGKSFELTARDVVVLDLKFSNFINTTTAQFIVKCKKGFYVRSLAVDLAKELNTVGYISLLRRNSVGPFNQENIIKLEKLREIVDHHELEKNLLQI